MNRRFLEMLAGAAILASSGFRQEPTVGGREMFHEKYTVENAVALIPGGAGGWQAAGSFTSPA